MYFNRGDFIIVDNEKLKTNGCIGEILGKHYQDCQGEDLWYGSYDVRLQYKDSTLETYIDKKNLKLYKPHFYCIKCGKPMIKTGQRSSWEQLYSCVNSDCDNALIYTPPETGIPNGNIILTTKENIKS